MTEQEFFQTAKTNFVHLLGIFEAMTKRQYLERFRMMYNHTDGDPRLKAFYYAAEQSTFYHVKRDKSGIVFTTTND